jgi:DNA polymerase-3 subunit beta
MTTTLPDTARVAAVTVPAAALSAAVKLCKLGTNTGRGALPNLSAVRLTGTGAGIKLDTFDYETHVSVSVPVDGYGTGDTFDTVTVSWPQLSDAVKAVGTRGTVAVTVNGDGAVTVGPIKLGTVPFPADELPAPPELPAGHTYAATDIREAVSRVLTAAGTDNTLPTLTGVYLTINAGTVSAAATDRYRLHYWAARTETGVPGGALVPARVVKGVCAAAAGAAVTLSLPTGGAGDTVRQGGAYWAVLTVAPSRKLPHGARVVARTLDGEFPRWEALLPSVVAGSFTVDGAELAAALSQVSAMLDRNRPVVVDVDPAGWVTVSTNTADTDTGTPAVTVTVRATVDGEPPARMAFAPAYLSGAVAAVTAGGKPAAGELVTVNMTTNNRPVVVMPATCGRCSGMWGRDVTCAGCTDDNGNPRNGADTAGTVRALVMPVRLAG